MQNNPQPSASMVSNTAAEVRPSADLADPGRSEEWWDAQQRVMLYLHALKVPAERSMEMALRALRRARADSRRIESPNLTRLAMLVLRKILSAEGLDCLQRVFCSPEDNHNPGTVQTLPFPAHRCVRTPEYAKMVFSPKGDLPVMPPLNRSSMRAEVIERSLLRSLVYKLRGKRNENG